MDFLITFIVLSIINVVFSTIRTLTTVKSGKVIASLISGGYFAFYNVMLIYTVADFPLLEKCIITFVCNVVGVWIVKVLEEKIRKDKLWKVECSVLSDYTISIEQKLEKNDISYNYVDTANDNYSIFNIYCKTQKESAIVKDIMAEYKAKYFVSESKAL